MYAPAYQLGSQNRDRYANRSFDDVEPHLAQDYEAVRGDSPLEWEDARPATRAAWDRVSQAS